VSLRLVLFDIDGTLLSASGASARALEAALVETFGATGPVSSFDYSGKTDPQIVRELLQGAGAADAEIAACLPLVLGRYHARLRGSLRADQIVPKPGVAALLGALARTEGVSLGLLTGNLEPCARLKLAPLDANRFFPFGAFGSDHEDRYRLLPVALERARSATGIAFEGGEVVIVGDSIHDVLCGRDYGARAVAVATGKTPAERLAEVGADAVLADFEDTAAALRAILDDGRAMAAKAG
jgi:phosphoglycolate phosphatase-like HAD superfamily hydrolase